MVAIGLLGVAATTIGAAPVPPVRPLPAPAPPLLTLETAQRFALANHPDIKLRQFDEAAALEAIHVARSAYAPQVYGEAVQTLAPPGTRIGAENAINDPTVIQRTSIGVGAQQYITDFGRTAGLIRAAEDELAAQAAQQNVTRDIVLLNVTEAYFEALRANALVVVADQTVSDRSTLLKRVSALQQAGLRSTLDVATAARDVSSARQQLVDARTRREDAFATLGEAMGTTDQRIYTLQDIHDLPPAPPDFDAQINTAFQRNPALSGLQSNVAAQQNRLFAIGHLDLPSVYAYGYVGATPFHTSEESIGSSYEAVGVTVNIPLFDGGALAAEQREGRAAAFAAAAALESERNTLAHDVRIAYDGVKSARSNVAVTQQLLDTAREALVLTQARYRIGLNSIVDVSAAQLSETEAAILRTNATYDYIVQEAALEYATGIIGTADILTGRPTTIPTTVPIPAADPVPSPSAEARRGRRFPF